MEHDMEVVTEDDTKDDTEDDMDNRAEIESKVLVKEMVQTQQLKEMIDIMKVMIKERQKNGEHKTVCSILQLLKEMIDIIMVMVKKHQEDVDALKLMMQEYPQLQEELKNATELLTQQLRSDGEHNTVCSKMQLLVKMMDIMKVMIKEHQDDVAFKLSMQKYQRACTRATEKCNRVADVTITTQQLQRNNYNATIMQPKAAANPRKDLSITREHMLEAQEMFRTANKVTRPEKALILGFMAGSRNNPFPKLGNIVTVMLSENIEEVTQSDGTNVPMLVETHFQMNYTNGEWKKIKKNRRIEESTSTSTPAPSASTTASN